MNTMYLTAGVLAAAGVVFHGVYGYLQIARRLDASRLPSSFLGDGRESLWMLRLSWHTLTAVLAVAAVVLISSGLNDTGQVAGPLVIGSILTLLVVGWIVGGGSTRRFRHPGPFVLAAVTILTFAGAL